ncbi:MAG: hypothetical protein AWT59_0686 [Candidatus Gallionella acididurans]|uniref:HEPN domain-containing protein n=1 Tax=Candidatus Gallionella acididurans TaxID=1796491 RepID=A0A139BVX9_9PROT|nr:MAG: hypothetical protein AWT59_0686 [Candidatus Gallionella acididurans]
MSTLRHKLMHQESEKRLHAAQLLSAASDDSDSAYLLQLIAFELLLKIVVEKVTQTNAHSHKYQDLFNSLPLEKQDEILCIAGERIGPSELSSDYAGVLMDLGSNFVKLRYPYEKYSHMIEPDYEKVGAKWIASGANTADADFRYHPEELFGLTFALQQVANIC